MDRKVLERKRKQVRLKNIAAGIEKFDKDENKTLNYTRGNLKIENK